ncbi:MAG: ArsR family transcriptional regulator [Desulfobacteraceae bacterium]|nr:MAG: ArsR family transcriptional regulator [Desulfobacteraceae bacterium]
MVISQAELFKILGVETRIQIIELLKERGPLGVNELSQALGITASAVSQHLKILRYADLVRSERQGYWIPYEINAEALEGCQELLSRVCTCGCRGTGKFREAELEKADDKVSLLKKWEKELLRELNSVRCRLEEMEKKK